MDNGGSEDGAWDSEDWNGELKGSDGDVEAQLPRAKAPLESIMTEMREFINSPLTSGALRRIQSPTSPRDRIP